MTSTTTKTDATARLAAPNRSRGFDGYRDEVQRKLKVNLLEMASAEISEQEWDQLRSKHAPKSRDRVWTVKGMGHFWLMAGLMRDSSFGAVGSHLSARVSLEVPDVAGLKINSGRWAEGRSRVPAEMLGDIRGLLAQRALQEAPEAVQWRGRRCLWFDGSTLSMSDQQVLRHHFGGPSNKHGDCPFPTARIVNLGVVGTRIVVGSRWGPYRASEKALTIPLLEDLLPGDIALGDRNFASAVLIGLIQQKKADVVMRKNKDLEVDKHPHREVGPDDWVLTLSVPRKVRKQFPHLPKEIEVRVCRVLVGEGEKAWELWIETTLLDAAMFPKEDLASLYLQRYGAAETSYRELKEDLYLGILRSKTVAGVDREIQARLAVYNYIRLEMVRAAKMAEVETWQISFREALRVILAYAPSLRQVRGSERAQIHRRMLQQIAAGRVVRRPGRREPRAVRRQAKPFPRLKGSRQLWRECHTRGP